MFIIWVTWIALRQLGNQDLVRSKVFAPAINVSNIVALRVDGDMIGIDAKILAHLLTHIGLVVAIFIQDKLIAHTVTAAVFHHVAAGMFQIHAVQWDVPKVGEHLRHVVVVGTGTVVAIIDNGGITVFKDIPRTVVAHPVRIVRGIHKGDIAHIDTGILETVLCTALIGRTDDTIHMAVV